MGLLNRTYVSVSTLDLKLVLLPVLAWAICLHWRYPIKTRVSLTGAAVGIRRCVQFSMKFRQVHWLWPETLPMPKSARFSNRQGNSRSMSRPGCSYCEVNRVLLGNVALLRTIRFIMLDLPSLNPRGNMRKQMSKHVQDAQGKSAAMVIPFRIYIAASCAFSDVQTSSAKDPCWICFWLLWSDDCWKYQPWQDWLVDPGISDISSDILWLSAAFLTSRNGYLCAYVATSWSILGRALGGGSIFLHASLSQKHSGILARFVIKFKNPVSLASSTPIVRQIVVLDQL